MTPCSPTCPGWLPFQGDWGDVRRCPACNRFATDIEATTHANTVFRRARNADVPPTTNLIQRARLITSAVTYRALYGHYPHHPDGPAEEQSFDDWAASMLEPS